MIVATWSRECPSPWTRFSAFDPAERQEALRRVDTLSNLPKGPNTSPQPDR
jgi:hypothetical protein